MTGFCENERKYFTHIPGLNNEILSEMHQFEFDDPVSDLVTIWQIMWEVYKCHSPDKSMTHENSDVADESCKSMQFIFCITN